MYRIQFSYLLVFFFSLLTLQGTATGLTDPEEKTGVLKMSRVQARPDLPGSLSIDFGFNSVPQNGGSGSFRLLGSRSLNLTYYYDFYMGQSPISIHSGLGVGLDRYKFDSLVTMTTTLDADLNKSVNLEGLGEVFSDIRSVDKSMFVTNYIDIPLEVRYTVLPRQRHKSFWVSAGGKVGVLFQSHTKVKYEDIAKDDISIKNRENFELEPIRYAFIARMGVGSFSAYYIQRLNPLFKGDHTPLGIDATNFTVGLSIRVF